MANLKACPFCGRKAIPLQIITQELRGYSIMCQHCGTALFKFNLESGRPVLFGAIPYAEDGWNRLPMAVLGKILTPEEQREPWQTREE